MVESDKPKIVFVMLDGLGDHSHQTAEGYKTPLQMAETPVLDALAS